MLPSGGRDRLRAVREIGRQTRQCLSVRKLGQKALDKLRYGVDIATDSDLIGGAVLGDRLAAFVGA